MKTILKTAHRTETDLDCDAVRFLFSLISASALIVGLWGMSCLIAGICSEGFFAMVRGYITAISGL